MLVNSQLIYLLENFSIYTPQYYSLFSQADTKRIRQKIFV